MSEINRVLVDREQDFTEAEIWFGLTDAYGLQGNNYFLNTITIKWFV